MSAAVAFCWLGMVLGISFLEAPLKFRAPGVTLAVGLGIGRVVLVVAVVLGPPDPVLYVGTGALVVLLGVQLLVVRPRLNARSDLVLAGGQAPRSRAHHGYIALEVGKVAALIAVGVVALTG